MPRKWIHPETVVLHEGYRSDEAVNAVSVPIYQTTAYRFESTEEADRVFSLEQDGRTYSRLMNPTCDVLGQRMAGLDGGAGALAVSSGQAATAIALLNLCQAGHNIVSSRELYGGIWNLLANTFKKMGIETRFVDPADPENYRRAADENTRCFYGETLANPKLEVFPIAEIAEIATEFGIPLVVDNTVAPLLCRPIDHGAAIVVYSATKYIGGHGNSLGGIIVDSGKFDWHANAERFPLFTNPDPGHSGIVWTEAIEQLEGSLGDSVFILKARMTLLRDLGSALSPFNAFLLLLGLETLPLRMKAHCRNAAEVAEMLNNHPLTERVIYPGLMAGESRRRAETYLGGGVYGGMVQVELVGGKEAGRRFIDSLELFYHVANIGDTRSLAIHPASTTHARLSPQDQLAAGVTPGSVRLSIGLEHIEDILADLEQALAAAEGVDSSDRKGTG